MSGPATESNGKIIPKATSKKTLIGLVSEYKDELARALPKHITPDRMARLAITALRSVRNLDKCDPASFMGCLITAAQLGLEPNTPIGECYLIPRDNKRGGFECTLMCGYQGLMNLARRSGEVASIYAFEVREGDEFKYQLGLDPDLKHIPSALEDREDKPITFVYAVAKMRGGETQFVALSRAQVLARKKRSAAARKETSPWTTDEAEMFKKTAIRALTKYLPKSIEMVRVETIENAYDRGMSAVFDVPEETAKALLAGGVIIDAESGGNVDPETGEVTNTEEAA